MLDEAESQHCTIDNIKNHQTLIKSYNSGHHFCLSIQMNHRKDKVQSKMECSLLFSN